MKKRWFVFVIVVFITVFAFAEDFTIEGKLGLGVDNPEETLEVNGSIKGGEFSSLYPVSTYFLNSSQLIFKYELSPTSSWDVGFKKHTNRSLLFEALNSDIARVDTTDYILFSNRGIGLGTHNFPEGTKLAVNGKVYATEINVRTYNNGWADYVFKDDYKLRSLQEVESFIKKNGHLPEIPNAKQVSEEGINLSEMQAKLLQKIEELTLYMIELKKENEILKKEISNVNKRK